MDYIREELRRQREALAGLLLGRGSRPGEGGGEDGAGAGTPFAEGGVQPEALTAGAELSPEGGRAVRPAERGLRGPIAGSGGLAAPGPSGSRPGAEGAGFAPMRDLLPGIPGFYPGTEEAERAAAVWEAAGQAASAEHGGWGASRPEEAAWAALAGIGPAAGADRAGRPGADFAPERGVTEFFQAERGGGSAEALSRAFQRDARRYDGGFAMY